MSDINSTKAEGRPRPTDMELMLYVDGELDEERIADVEALLKESEGARRKVTALRYASGMVREHTMAAAPAIDVASSVMAKIEAGEASEADPPAKNGAGVDMAPVRLPRSSTKDSRPAAANDNSRSIFTLAAIAVAAAAGMMIWGRMGEAPVRPTASVPVMTQEAAPEAQVRAPAPPAEPSTSEGDDEHGVEVAAVDFGAHMGSIFYVPTDATAGATTTVVWVDDDVAGGK